MSCGNKLKGIFAGIAVTACPEHLLFSTDEDWNFGWDEERFDYLGRP